MFKIPDNLYEISALRIPFFELSSQAVNGRRYIKFVVHEIFNDDSSWQDNGISWLESYTQQNMQTAINMSITAELLDREVPLNHGFTDIKDGMPVFENAAVVGHTHNAFIEQLELNGRLVKALICEGTLDEMRYPRFVAWLESQAANKEIVTGSVEISSKVKGEPIVYEGGYKPLGRKPQIYDYTGFSIITVKPANSSAIMLELNNNTNKEDVVVDEKMLKAEFEALSDKIAELNTLAAKDSEINSLNTALAEKDSKITELLGEIEKANAAIEEKGAEVSKLNETISELNGKVAEVEKKQLVSELNTAIASFSDEQKECVKDRIEVFSANPIQAEIDSIVSAIKVGIADKVIEAASKRVSEQNSAKTPFEFVDIFGNIDEGKQTESGSLF